MSMQAWEVPNPNDNGNNFGGNTIDPSMAFAGTPTSNNFDFNAMQNPQLQRMQNGTMRNGTASPGGFNPSMYQSTPVVPAKRQHEQYVDSPRQASRSQTPQQGPYPGYQGGMNGQTPTPYQHLQHPNSSNASPSPIMQNQQFNHSAIPQRMSTASPSPYSPAGSNFGPQGSPAPSEFGNRVETPSNQNPAFMQGANGMMPNAQNFNGPPGSTMPGFAPNGMAGYGAGMTPDQQRAHQAQLMRQVQAQNMAAQQQAQARAQAQAQAHAHAQAQAQMQGMNNPGNMAAMQQRAVREQVMRYQATKLDAVLKQPEDFAMTVSTFMQQRNQPFQKQCIVGGRPVHCAYVFNFVAKAGGSRRLTMQNGWPQVAMALQIPPQLAGEIQNYYQQNLLGYEPTWMQAMQVQGQKIAMQQQQAQQHQLQQQQQQQQRQGGQPDPSALNAQIQANRAMQFSQDQMAAMQQGRKQSTSLEPQTPVKAPQSGQQANGMPPQHTQNNTGPPGPSQTQPTPPKAATVEPKQEPEESMGGVKPAWTTPLSKQISETFSSSPLFVPRPDPSFPDAEIEEQHGGLVLGSSILNAVVSNESRARPENPRITDLGSIEIHALLMSLKSGIPGEVKLALDTISAIVWEPIGLLGPYGPKSEQMPGQAHRIHLDFKESGDLVESLVDCAEAQLDFLADNGEVDEYADSVALRPVEEVAVECVTEMHSLQDIPEHGSLDYELDQTAEKLLCITTILRNLTDTSHQNRMAIADPSVVKLMANVIRLLGTRHLLLRTWRNTFDFLKDSIIYFSAVASDITLSSKDEASWILQYLLSFSPIIRQVHSDDTEIYFPSYFRGSHKYLPFAIQTLAKLLASGDPNRSYLKSVFAADIASGSSPDLLTRAFAMCISPLPSLSDEIYPKIRARSTFLTQGLLAADSLVSLIPQTEHNLARSWLSSEDGFAERLLRCVAKLSIDFEPPRVMTPHGPLDDGHGMVQEYGISILRKLAERAKDAETTIGQISATVVFKKALLSAAMLAGPMHERILQPLVSYLSLDT